MSNPAFEKYIETLEITFNQLKKTVKTAANIDNYEGSRNAEGKPHGFGKLIFIGVGEKNGVGKMIYSGGSIYEGNWINGIKNGYGKQTEDSGTVYEGEWKNGKRNGNGKETVYSGTIYEGEWKNDERNGYGIINYGKGSALFGIGCVFKGEFLNGLKHGKGIIKDPDGLVFNEIWENGNCIENYSTITDDRDGQNYKIVKIGNQVWMAENLNYKTTDSHCSENDDKNAEKYGRLYNAREAKEACLPGFRLPSKEDFEELIQFLGGEEFASPKLKKMKLLNLWLGKNAFEDNKNKATNECGFNALPAGIYSADLYQNEWSFRFSCFGYEADFMSSTDRYDEDDHWKKFTFSITSDSVSLYERCMSSFGYGCSVRYIKNEKKSI